MVETWLMGGGDADKNPKATKKGRRGGTRYTAPTGYSGRGAGKGGAGWRKREQYRSKGREGISDATSRRGDGVGRKAPIRGPGVKM